MSFILPESEEEWETLASSLSEESMRDLVEKTDLLEDEREDAEDVAASERALSEEDSVELDEWEEEVGLNNDEDEAGDDELDEDEGQDEWEEGDDDDEITERDTPPEHHHEAVTLLPPDPMVVSIFEQRRKFWQVREIPATPIAADDVLDFHSFIHGVSGRGLCRGERNFFRRMNPGQPSR